MSIWRSSLPTIVQYLSKSAFALLCGILLFYSASWVLSGIVISSAPPLWSVVIRLTSSLAAICVINTFTRRFLPISDARSLAGSLVVLSVLGFAIFFVATYLALRSLHPSQLVLALSLIPGFTYVIGLIALGDRHSSASLIGIIVSTVAVFLFAAPSLNKLMQSSTTGLSFAFLAAIGYALYGVIYQRRLSAMPVLGILPYLISISIVIVAVLALTLEGLPTGLSLRDTVYLVFIGAVLAAPIYVFYNLLISHHGALLASLISVAAPLLTMGLETIVGLRPSIGFSELLIGLLGSAGVALVIFDRSKRNRK